MRTYKTDGKDLVSTLDWNWTYDKASLECFMHAVIPGLQYLQPARVRSDKCKVGLCLLGAVANYQHFVSIERCSFERISVWGIQVWVRAREEAGRFRDVKRCVATGIEPGSQALAYCAITARPPQHDPTEPCRTALDVFQDSCYTIVLPSVRHPDRASKPPPSTSVTGIKLESGAREAIGTFRDVKKSAAIVPGCQELASAP